MTKQITIKEAKQISDDLKALLPEFTKDMNSKGECQAYLEAVSRNIPLKEFYSEEQIKEGYHIARDTIHIVAHTDPDYDGVSSYHAFCSANPNSYRDGFTLRKEISTKKAKQISNDLKASLPEFAKDVNPKDFYENNYDFHKECKAYVKAVGKHIPLKAFYSEDEIKHGYAIARDTMHIVAKTDPDYDGVSSYHAFCDANPNSYRDGFTLRKEISTKKAKQISNDLKASLPEFAKDVNPKDFYENNYDYHKECKAYVKAVGKYIPLKEYYSEDEIKHGYAIARDTIHIVAHTDPDYDGESNYHAFCDATLKTDYPITDYGFTLYKEEAIEVEEPMQNISADL